MKTTEKFLLAAILSCMFAASGVYAIHEYHKYLADDASQALIQCKINPVNGQSLEAK